MPTDKAALKQQASDQFDASLASAIGAEIDRDEQEQKANTGGIHKPNQVEIESIGTLFLADRFFKKLGEGEFSGLPTVTWNGMDDFVFDAHSSNQFSYKTSKGQIITPQLMFTDGGSVPRILRGLKKFSSWGYAPAFIVHDWLFTAKKCNYMPDGGVDFHATAEIMAEAMKTLMTKGYKDFSGKVVKIDKAEDTLYLMYQAVNSFVAKKLWDDNTSVSCIFKP